MDGEAIQEAFASCSGPDCLKAVLPKYGQRLKVYNCVKAALGEAYQQKVRNLNVYHYPSYFYDKYPTWEYSDNVM